MALIKCKECKKEVSDAAEVCPHCGTESPKGMRLFTKFFMALVALAVIGSILSPTKPASVAAPVVAASPTPIQKPVKTYTPAQKSAALAKLSVEKDKVTGYTWYRDKSSPHQLGSNTLQVYLGQDKTDVWLRFRVQYSGDDWLFIHGMIVKTDGINQEFVLPVPERNVGRGYVTEWVDVQMDKERFAMVMAVANSKETILRLEGDQFQKDRTISATEKKALLNVVAAYRALGGTEF